MRPRPFYSTAKLLVLICCAKVLAQNTCSFFSNSETTSESQKQLVRLKNFSLFPNMGSEILCQFLLGNNEGILERQFRQKCFSPKPNVEALVDISACRVKFTLQNALFCL